MKLRIKNLPRSIFTVGLELPFYLFVGFVLREILKYCGVLDEGFIYAYQFYTPFFPFLYELYIPAIQGVATYERN